MKGIRHFDWMMLMLATFGLFLLWYLVYHLLHEVIPEANRELLIHTLGIIEGLIVAIYSYYFGSSAGSRIKDMKDSPDKPPA